MAMGMTIVTPILLRWVDGAAGVACGRLRNCCA